MAGHVFLEDKIGKSTDLVLVTAAWDWVVAELGGCGLEIYFRMRFQKALNGTFKDFKQNTAGKKKAEWVLARVM